MDKDITFDYEIAFAWARKGGASATEATIYAIGYLATQGWTMRDIDNAFDFVD